MYCSETADIMKEEPLVSVVIPVYNVGAYLARCLESVIGQTYRNVEIIVIDDGSTDDSPAICDAFAQKDSRIRVFHEKNRGHSAARNSGMMYARGDYLIFLDSDDWMESKAVEVLVDAMMQSYADIVTAGFITEYKEKRVIPSAKKEHIILARGQKILLDFFDGVISDVVWNKLYRIDVFNEICFPVGRYYEDIATSWKLMRNLSENNGTVAILSDNLYHYRVRRSSTSHRNSFQDISDYWDAYMEQYNQLPAYRKQIMTGCFIAIGKMWVRYGRFSREDKEKAAGLIEIMHVFSRRHFHQVISGKYTGKVKLYCLLSQFHSPAVRWLCHYIGLALMWVRDHRRKQYE